jgi:nucleotide-binding universal stress UspA family protein
MRLAVKVLIAVDSSAVSEKAVALAGTLWGRQPAGVAITLFHVVESLPDYIVSRSQTGPFQQVVAEWAAFTRQAGEALLARCAARLTEAGIPAAQVTTQLCLRDALPEAKRVVAAQAIIEEMKAGDYKLVLIGRRNTASQTSSIVGGVAEKVIREGQGRTICVVD